jgi:hypothetical protein
MKTSSKIFLGIGVPLVVLQCSAYKGLEFEFPVYHDGDFGNYMAKLLGSFVGYNFFGLAGIVLIVISLSRRKKKTKQTVAPTEKIEESYPDIENDPAFIASMKEAEGKSGIA